MRSPENRIALHSLITGVPSFALKVLDLNLRRPFYSADFVRSLLSICNVLKLNDDELMVLAGMLGRHCSFSPFFQNGCGGVELAPEPCAFVGYLVKHYSLEYLILTCGAQGSFIFAKDGRSSYAPSVKVDIVDTVGAGDAFAAVCVDGLLNRLDLDEIQRRAARHAGFVCSRAGGMPAIPKSVLE